MMKREATENEKSYISMAYFEVLKEQRDTIRAFGTCFILLLVVIPLFILLHAFFSEKPDFIKTIISLAVLVFVIKSRKAREFLALHFPRDEELSIDSFTVEEYTGVFRSVRVWRFKSMIYTCYYIGNCRIEIPSHWTGYMKNGEIVTAEIWHDVFTRDGEKFTDMRFGIPVSVKGRYSADREVPLGLLSLGKGKEIIAASILVVFIITILGWPTEMFYAEKVLRYISYSDMVPYSMELFSMAGFEPETPEVSEMIFFAAGVMLLIIAIALVPRAIFIAVRERLILRGIRKSYSTL